MTGESKGKCIWGLLEFRDDSPTVIDCPYGVQVSTTSHSNPQLQGICHLCMLARVLNRGVKVTVSGSLRKDGW